MKNLLLIFYTTLILSFSCFVKTKGQACSNTNPCAFTGGDPLRKPIEVISSGGVATIDLTVDVTQLTIEWLTLFRRTYNGDFPGPTWRIKRGDTITVNVINELTLPQKTETPNSLRLPNSTNLHTHGLHISSASPQDNVFQHIEPRETYQYVYEIDPENPSGTYWYHPHLHGGTIFQVHGGLAGMIIVEDPTDSTVPSNIQSVSCPNNCEHEYVLVFQPFLAYVNNAGRGFANIQREIQDNELFHLDLYDLTGANAGQTLEEYMENRANNIDIYTTNGQISPTASFAVGQMKRFRMVNAAGSALLELMITNSGSNDAATGCVFMEIAYDGVYLNEARPARLGKTLIVPSSKADWLVVCDQPGNYELRSVPSDDDILSIGGFERYNTRALLLMNITGTATTTTVPTSLPSRPTWLQDYSTLTEAEVTGHFVVEASPGTRLNRERFSSNTYYRYKMEVGTIQQWYLTNADPRTGHPIHIHINHFQVIDYTAYTGPVGIQQQNNLVYVSVEDTSETCYYQHAGFTNAPPLVNTNNETLQYLGHDIRYNTLGAGTLGYVQAKDIRDVILVPPLANITIRFNAHKYTGEVVIHCHILNHEDMGMMMTVEIVAQGESTTANILSGNAAPGQCRSCDPFPFNQDVSTCIPITPNGDVSVTRSSGYLWTLAFLPYFILENLRFF